MGPGIWRLGAGLHLPATPLAEPRNAALIERATLAVIFGAAAFLRLAGLEAAPFRQDDVGLWSAAWQFTRHPELLSSGISSSLGIPNGPVQTYLLAPAVAFFGSPVAGYVVVALLNWVSVVLLWAFARIHYGRLIAGLAAGLAAVSPWAIIFSRRLWGDDMTAPFVVLLVASLCTLGQRGRRRDHIWPFVWFSLGAQVSLAALAHGLTLLVGLILVRQRLRPVWLLAGGLIGLTLMAPYLVNEIVPNLRRIEHLTGRGGAGQVWDGSSLAYLFHLVSNEGYQAYANHLGALLDTSTGWPRWFSLFLQFGLGLGLVTATWIGLRGLRPAGAGPVAAPTAAPFLLPVLVVVLPALLLVRHRDSVPILVNYLLIGFPFHFLLVAQGLVSLPRIARRVAAWQNWSPSASSSLGRVLAGSLIIIIVLQVGLHLWLARLFFDGLDRYWPDDDYGAPLWLTQRLGDELLMKDEPATRRLVVGEQERDRVVAQLFALEHPDLQAVNAELGLVVPADPAVRPTYLVDLAGQAPGSRFFRKHFQPVRTYTLPGTGITYGVFQPQSKLCLKALQAQAPEPLPARFNSLLSLQSVRLTPEMPDPGVPLLTALFRIDQPLPWRKTPTFAFRLKDALGKVHADENIPLGVVSRFEPGDWVLTWYRAPTRALPDWPVSATLGLYLVESGQARQVLAERPSRPPKTSVRTGWIYQPPAEPPTAAFPLAYRFGPAIRLVGYDLQTSGVRHRRVSVTLYWRTLTIPDRDYTVFVHLVDQAGRLIAQHDGPVAGGHWPTSLWRPGDLVEDPHTITLPTERPLKSLSLRVGLYNPQTGKRLGGENTFAEAPLGKSSRAGG